MDIFQSDKARFFLLYFVSGESLFFFFFSTIQMKITAFYCTKLFVFFPLTSILVKMFQFDKLLYQEGQNQSYMDKKNQTGIHSFIKCS